MRRDREALAVPHETEQDSTLCRSPPRPQEPAGVAILRAHRRKFLIGSFASWAVTSLAVLPIWVVLVIQFLARGGSWRHPTSLGWALLGCALLLETVQACVYIVAPRRAWGAASDVAMRMASVREPGGWLVSAGPPRFPVWTVPISIVLSVTIPYWGFGLFARLAYVLAWLIWCDHVARRVAICRWARSQDGERVLEIETLDGSRHARLEGVDVRVGEVRLLDQGQQVSWQAITPLHTLARDLEPAGALLQTSEPAGDPSRAEPISKMEARTQAGSR